MTKPQEVNGTNGKAALPIADAAAKGAEHSTDSEQDEAGDTDEPGNSKSQSTFELNKRNNVFFKCLKENVQIIFNAENSFSIGIVATLKSKNTRRSEFPLLSRNELAAPQDPPKGTGRCCTASSVGREATPTTSCDPNASAPPPVRAGEMAAYWPVGGT